MEYFRMPTKICMGEGSIKELEHIEAKQVFIICDPFMKSSNKVGVITDILDSSGTAYRIFADVVPDPSVQLVSQAVTQIGEDTDVIIALGGGSAIDTAKVVRKVFETASGIRTKFIAIPTTSGTGSEMTSFAVVSDTETKSKLPLVDCSLLPDLAILECDFTMSVPPSITADTGIDVLTHALEAIVSLRANDFTDAYAIQAVNLVFKYLQKTVKNGEDKQARIHMHNASAMAGIAFNEASLGICHSLAHALGGHFHIPHGRSNAMLLPHVMEYNLYDKGALGKYAELARMLGFGSYDDASSAKALIRRVRNLIKNVKIPVFLDGIIDIDTYRDSVDAMAQAALLDKCTITNPRQPSLRDLIKLYKALIKQRI